MVNQIHSGFDLITGHRVDFHESLADGTYTGLTCWGTAGGDISQWDAVYVAADGDFEQADADAVATMPCVAICVQTLLDTESGLFLLWGFVHYSTWSLTQGGIVYPSTVAGVITTIIPAGAGDYVQVIGIAFTEDILYFSPSFELVKR